MILVPPGPADRFPEIWGRLTLADRLWPGRARVTCSRENDWDRPKAPGEHGAKAKLKGTKPAKISITIEYWEEDHDEEIYAELLLLVEPPPGKDKLDAVTISHAVTIRRHVSQVTVDSIEGPVKSEDGMYTLTIQATEERPTNPKNATGTASGAGGLVCSQLRQSYTEYLLAGQDAANRSVLATSSAERAALLGQSEIAFAAAADVQAQIAARKCPPAGQGPTTDPTLTPAERAALEGP